MPLEEYRRKRAFDATPEPSGSPATAERAKRGEGLRFVVQKHAASRLHYDFRLELDGVLLSWAVPKGPSYDTRERRLAVQVEDHPIEYGEFEGVIPKGQYGGGTVMVWDRGTWEPLGDPREMYEHGALKFGLHGSKLEGRWTLVRMKRRPGEERDNWLLIKERDDRVRPQSEYDVEEAEPHSAKSGRSMPEITKEADAVWESDTPGGGPNTGVGGNGDGESGDGRKPKKKRAAAASVPAPADVPGAVKASMPTEAAFELATRVKSVPPGDEWVHEIKYDGYRAMCFLRDGRVRFVTRGGKDWTERLGDLPKAVAQLPADEAVFDGEVVALDAKGVASFGELQSSLSAGGKGVAYAVFDLVYLDGFDLRKAALSERKALLASLLSRGPTGGPLRYSDHITGSGEAFRQQACAMALEGVVSKRPTSGYVAGRTRDWVKVRCLERQEFVVGGWTEPEGSRTGFGALLLGVHDPDGSLRYSGRVGTGFNERLLRDLTARLRKLEVPDPPFAHLPRAPWVKRVHWARPETVVEVSFLEWTRDGQLRQSSFAGLREDKPAEEVVRERAAEPPAAGAPPEAPAAEPRETFTDPPPPAAPPRAAGKAGGTEIVAGVAVSNPGRLLWPDVGVTKLELARYYEAVADAWLVNGGDRLLTLVRCPLGHEKECFYQKHADKSYPASIKELPLETRGGTKEFIYVESAQGLVSLVQLGSLEIHAWGSRVDDPERPDRLIWDLDPGPGLGWDDIVEGATEMKGILEALGLVPFVRTTGGKGLHVVVPVERRAPWEDARAFTKAVANVLVAARPARYTARMAKSERGGRIFVDYVRNAREATAISSFSSRARPGATVAVPVTWEELRAGLDPAEFTVRSVPERLRTLERDPWADMQSSAKRVTAAMRAAVGMPQAPRT